MEGVHPPSPSSFAPQRSRPTIDFFCAPRRLSARTKLKSTCELREHPQEQDSGIKSEAMMSFGITTKNFLLFSFYLHSLPVS